MSDTRQAGCTATANDQTGSISSGRRQHDCNTATTPSHHYSNKAQVLGTWGMVGTHQPNAHSHGCDIHHLAAEALGPKPLVFAPDGSKNTQHARQDAKPHMQPVNTLNGSSKMDCHSHGAPTCSSRFKHKAASSRGQLRRTPPQAATNLQVSSHAGRLFTRPTHLSKALHSSAASPVHHLWAYSLCWRCSLHEGHVQQAHNLCCLKAACSSCALCCPTWHATPVMLAPPTHTQQKNRTRVAMLSLTQRGLSTHGQDTHCSGVGVLQLQPPQRAACQAKCGTAEASVRPALDLL